MRIIAGELRSRIIYAPDGINTRPTTDKAREGVFSSIQNMVWGKKVLDLYAGSGAMGIEALSRGAESAVFVDYLPGAVKAIKNNVKTLGLESKTEILLADCRRLPGRISGPFDIVFMDPPYGKGLIQETVKNLAGAGLISAETLIIAEHEGEESFEGFNIIKQKRYGKSHFTYIKAG